SSQAGHVRDESDSTKSERKIVESHDGAKGFNVGTVKSHDCERTDCHRLNDGPDNQRSEIAESRGAQSSRCNSEKCKGQPYRSTNPADHIFGQSKVMIEGIHHRSPEEIRQTV